MEKFNQIYSIEIFTCLLGLSFPDSATDFQKAALTLAHLMAAVRESVLKGSAINDRVSSLILELAEVVNNNKDNQK